MKNPYDVLGVVRGSNLEVCKKAYRLKSRLHHPDAGGNDASFIELCEAWKLINSGSVLNSMKIEKKHLKHKGLFDYELVVY